MPKNKILILIAALTIISGLLWLVFDVPIFDSVTIVLSGIEALVAILSEEDLKKGMGWVAVFFSVLIFLVGLWRSFSIQITPVRPTPIPIDTPTSTPTNMPTPTSTSTPTSTPTNMPTPTSSDTPEPTLTKTPAPILSNTPVPVTSNNSFPYFINQGSSDFAVSGCAGGTVGNFGTSDNQIRFESIERVDAITQIDVYIFALELRWQFPCHYPTWELIVKEGLDGTLDLFFEPATTTSTSVTYFISIRYADGTVNEYEISGVSGECCK